MNTLFTFKATKANQGTDVQYQVDLGQDILDGLHEDTVKAHATANAKVEVQNRKGALLRQAESIEDAMETLKTYGYEGATVEVYVPTPKAPRKELTVDDMVKQVQTGKISKQDLLKRLNELA